MFLLTTSIMIQASELYDAQAFDLANLGEPMVFSTEEQAWVAAEQRFAHLNNEDEGEITLLDSGNDQTHVWRQYGFPETPDCESNQDESDFCWAFVHEINM